MKRLALLSLLTFLAAGQSEKVFPPSAEEQTQIKAKTAALENALTGLRGKIDDDLFADIEIYHKAAVYIQRYPDEYFAAAYPKQTLTVLDRGLARANAAKSGDTGWTKQKGRLARAYRSAVDGSVQPYGLLIPASYTGDKPVRLDVVLHGRAATMNEMSFLFSHENEKPLPPEQQDTLVLEVFGRTNNAYRWAGETDVYEALASVQKRYRIDPNRIVLRGFSMGGAGTWHIGLHDPSRWAAIEAGAGFTETKTYAKQVSLPPAVEATLHIYDAQDYAHNAYDVPTIGYGGEIDPQKQASFNIREKLTSEGLSFTPDGLNWTTKNIPALFLVGPQTAHKFHPDSKQRSDAFIAQVLAQSPRSEDHIHFVTYTPRYGKDFWVEVDALEKQYEKAEVTADRTPDRRTITIRTSNIRRLFLPDPASGGTVTVDGQTFKFSNHMHVAASHLVLEKANGKWTASDEMLGMKPQKASGKVHGLQGPIDDAFMAPFLCVRPTGTPLTPLLGTQAKLRLERFQAEFAKYMRGDVRIKDDRDVTADDMAKYHVILFGDPSSNRLLAKMLGQLPLTWTKSSVTFGAQKFAGENHLPVLIYPNPLQPSRYVVLNTGHTFHESDFRGTNALLFPRLGDWTVLKIDDKTPNDIADHPVVIGLFDSDWKLPR